MLDYTEYEDQPTDELVYGRCRLCKQLEELGPEDLCFICEGHDVLHRIRKMKSNHLGYNDSKYIT